MTTNQDDGWTGYYQELLHNAPIGIFTSTPEGRYTMVNAALAKMYGYSSPEEMMSEVTDISRQIYINPCKGTTVYFTLPVADSVIFSG